MNCGYQQMNRELSRYYKPPEEVLFCAISALQSVPGCEDTITELSNRLENLLQVVTPSNDTITLGNLTYYPTGVVSNRNVNGENVLLSPWTYSPVAKKKQKPRLKPKYNVNECKNLLAQTCGLFSIQLKIKEGARIVPQEKLNAFSESLKKIDILNIGHMNNSGVLDVDIPGMFNAMRRFINNFIIVAGISNGRCSSDYTIANYILSDEALEDIVKIYISGRSYWVSREMNNYIENIDPKKTIPLEEELVFLVTSINNECDLMLGNFGIYEEQPTLNYRGERYTKIVGYDLSKICELPMYKYAIKLYDLLMNTQTENIKQIALKLGMIQKDYIPLALQPESDTQNENTKH